MTFNFSEIELKTLDGEVIENCNFHKTLANLLYHQSATVDFVDIAIEINRGNSVELTEAQVNEVKRVVELPESCIATHARKAFHDFITE